MPELRRTALYQTNLNKGLFLLQVLHNKLSWRQI